MRGGNREDIEIDDASETFLLILLVLAIAILLYVRTRIVERMRRDQGEQRPQGQQAQNHGVFPPPGDPARHEWAIQR
jgi:SEL1 protein